MCSQMLICVHDVNSGPLDVASLCNAQPGHMYWEGWLGFQHTEVRVLTSKPLSIVGLIEDHLCEMKTYLINVSSAMTDHMVD